MTIVPLYSDPEELQRKVHETFSLIESTWYAVRKAKDEAWDKAVGSGTDAEGKPVPYDALSPEEKRARCVESVALESVESALRSLEEPFEQMEETLLNLRSESEERRSFPVDKTVRAARPGEDPMARVHEAWRRSPVFHVAVLTLAPDDGKRN